MRIPVLAALLALAVTAATAQVYKWVDKDGRTHYGEKPPEDVKATKLNIAPPPSPSAEAPPPAAGGAAAGTPAKAAEPPKYREPTRAEIERDLREQQAQREANANACEAAQRRLATLYAGGGDLDEATRKKKIDEDRKVVEDSCRKK